MNADKTLPLSAEYLLLVLDDAKGKFVIDASTVDVGVAAATLLDLIAAGQLTIDADDKPGKQKLRAVGSGPVDQTLADAWRKVDGRRFSSAVETLTGWTDFRNRAKTLRHNELLRLVHAGVLAERESKVLGLFSVERYPTRHDRVEGAIRDRLERVLVGGADVDEPTGALIALLNATRALPKVFGHLDKGEVKRRGKEISAGNWAGDEVRRAIDNMTAVMAAVVIASSSATIASS